MDAAELPSFGSVQPKSRSLMMGVLRPQAHSMLIASILLHHLTKLPYKIQHHDVRQNSPYKIQHGDYLQLDQLNRVTVLTRLSRSYSSARFSNDFGCLRMFRRTRLISLTFKVLYTKELKESWRTLSRVNRPWGPTLKISGLLRPNWKNVAKQS